MNLLIFPLGSEDIMARIMPPPSYPFRSPGKLFLSHPSEFEAKFSHPSEKSIAGCRVTQGINDSRPLAQPVLSTTVEAAQE
jgi:hypothetical protein